MDLTHSLLQCIIFSEWDDMLELIARALAENGIKHQRCKGGKAVSIGVAAFRADPCENAS